MSPRIWLQKLKLAPNSKETSAKISVLVTILWTEPWICAQKLKFDHHKLSVNLAVSPQIGCFFKTAPLLFLSSYWNGHVSVTIRWINHNIQSTGPVGLTSLWGSVLWLFVLPTFLPGGLCSITRPAQHVFEEPGVGYVPPQHGSSRQHTGEKVPKF